MPHKKEMHPNAILKLKEYQERKRKEKEMRALLPQEAPNPPGHPPIFKSEELKQMEEKAEEYFESCKEHLEERLKVNDKGESVVMKVEVPAKPWTAAGLATSLGTTRATLFKYASKDDEIGVFIRQLLVKIESGIEEYLLSGRPTAGASFMLRNGYGWVEQTEQKINGAFSLSNLFDKAKNATDEEKATWLEMEKREQIESSQTSDLQFDN